MFKQKKKNGLLKEAVRLALFASLASATVVPVAMAQEEEVEEVVVTGSRITRSTIEESGNLISMDREDIDATGDLMIADVLRSSPLNSYGSFSERSGSSAQSNATIDLRGLGDSRTLVLIDGHRIPGSPNLGAASVNINMIPMAAVERIEMLPDASSSVYGSDAIAGVVNIIMKKNYDGLQFTLRQGERANDDGGDSGFSILGGITNDRGNVTFGIEHNHRDAIFDADRDFTSAWIDDTNGDGRIDTYIDTDGISFYGKSLELYDEGTGRLTDNGTIGAFDNILAAPGCPTTDGFQGVMGAAAFGLPDGTLCTYAYANISANKAELDRTNTYISSNFAINDNHEFFMNAIFSRVESFGRYAPPAAAWSGMPLDYQDNPFDIDALFAAGELSHIIERDDDGNPLLFDGGGNSVAIDSNGNPVDASGDQLVNPNYDPDDPDNDNEFLSPGDFSSNAILDADGNLQPDYDNYDLTGYYRWTNIGNRDNYVTDTQYDLTAGMRGDINDDVSYEVYGQYNRYDSKESGRYYLSNLGRDKVLADGIDPFSDEGAGIMRATTGQDNFTTMSKLYGHIQWNAGDIFDAGEVIVLAGAETFDTTYANQYDAASEAGLIGGSAGNSSAGDRSVDALFVEAVIPLPSEMELDAALRYDNYSDFGSKVSPSMGLTWGATEEVKLRGRWSKGFRAPSLADLNGPETFSAEDATDYKSCFDDGIAAEDCTERQFDTFFTSNSELGAEESTNFSLGVNWEFAEDWTADIAYWNIEITDMIGTRTPQSLFYAEAAGIDLSDDTQGNYVDRTGANPIVHATSDNEGELNASGIDIQINGMIETELGTFSPSFLASQSLAYEQQVYYKGPVQDTAGFSYQPELRWVLGLGWEMGPHAVNFSVNFIGDYSTDDSIVIEGTEAKLVTSDEKVDTWTTMNLSYSFDAGNYGKFKIGATNLTNEDPVLDSEGKFARDAYDLYDATGRVVYTEYTVEF